jgi:guanylate kinase
MMDKLVQTLKNYKPTPQTAALIKQTTILLLVGPTGGGKDSLKQALLARGGYHKIISHTSRPPRINQGVPEQEGKEYHFIDVRTAECMVEEHAFVEAKTYSGNIYGTSVAEIQAAHDGSEIAVMDLEVQGVAEYKAIDPNIIAVFLLPPDFETWQSRLRGRYGETVDPADLRRRMQTALHEIDQLLATDYYFTVINKTLDSSVAEVQAIVASRQHDPAQEAAARQLARQLAAATRAYLETPA